MLRLYNNAPCRWRGWVPFTVPDHVPLADNALGKLAGDKGTTNQVQIVAGNQLATIRRAWAKVDLQGVEAAAVMLEELHVTEERLPDPRTQLPAEVLIDPMGRVGCTINGILLELVPNEDGTLFEVDGPALRAHGRALVSTAVWADIWLCWVPSEPWLRFELLFNCAHQNRAPLVVELLPESGFELRIGTATVVYHGARMGNVMRGEQIAQGQARAFSGVAGWLDQMTEEEKQQTVSGTLYGGPFAIATEWQPVLAGLGVPDMQEHFNCDAWVRNNFDGALRQQWSLTPTVQMGINWNSPVTGAQEDQVFCANGGEAFVDHRLAPVCAFIRYQVALSQCRRPCHWREANGELLEWDAHPRLVLWSGQPHWHTGVSPDRLGLSRGITTLDTFGWFGPDREHWFYSTLWFAAATTGSPLLQWMLEAQARLVWFGETVTPGWSTTSPDAARSVGWLGLVLCALIELTGNVGVRTKVKQRALDKLELVYKPMLPPKNAHGLTVWDPRTGDTTSGTLQGYQWAIMLWQQSIGALGLYRIAKLMGHDVCAQQAIDAADTVFRLGWHKTADGAWLEWEGVGVYGADGPFQGDRLAAMQEARPLPDDQYVAGIGAGRTGWFRHAWMPCALAVLEAQGHAEATALLDQLRAEARPGVGNIGWIVPKGRLPA